MLFRSNIETLLLQNDLSVQADAVQGLYLNIRYNGETLTCITGTSFKTFTMDKTLEHAWDEYELEGKRSPFSFDEGKAEVSYIFPIRVFGKDGVRVKELFFDKAVNVKCIECCDLSFDK